MSFDDEELEMGSNDNEAYNEAGSFINKKW